MVLATRWKGKPFALAYSGGHVSTSSEQTVLESCGIGNFSALTISVVLTVAFRFGTGKYKLVSRSIIVHAYCIVCRCLRPFEDLESHL